MAGRFEFSDRTERQIRRIGAAIGLAIVMYTLGGAMEGRGLELRNAGPVSDSLVSDPPLQMLAATASQNKTM